MATKYDFGILRILRRKRNLTLEELAKASGLSYPTVASVETNKVFPSLKTIDAVAGVLQIPAGELVSLAARRNTQTRQTESLHAQVLRDSGINLEKVNAANFGGLKIFRAAVKRGSVVNSMKLHADCNCHEVCYCLSGSIEIRVQNETHRLNDDDVILFDGSLDHEYTAVSEAEYLTIHLPKATRVESLLESAAI